MVKNRRNYWNKLKKKNFLHFHFPYTLDVGFTSQHTHGKSKEDLRPLIFIEMLLMLANN